MPCLPLTRRDPVAAIAGACLAPLASAAGYPERPSVARIRARQDVRPARAADAALGECLQSGILRWRAVAACTDFSVNK